MNAQPPVDRPVDVIIIGAGISGIGMAAYLVRNCPNKSFVVLERRRKLGGTWDLFRYPGVRSDSDMYTLGYSFEPWRESKSIASGEAIRGYLEGVADKFGIAGMIRYGEKVVSADWNSETASWSLEIEDEAGGVSRLTGRFLFLGTGYYDHDQAHFPQVEGLSTFAGQVIQPQFWPENLDYAGKRIAVIGSGATAATIVPAMAEAAAQVTLVQRTPSYYLTEPSRDGIADFLRRLLPAGAAHRLTRFKNALVQDIFVKLSRSRPQTISKMLSGQVARQLGDNFDPADFSPPYAPWDQRVCLIPDGDLFRAMASGKVTIATGKIASADATGILLEDGRHIDADIIVMATGLTLSALGKVAISLNGEPIDLSRHFHYRNCMFSNVPNLASVFGYLNAAWTFRVEMVAEWLCRLFGQMDAWQADVATPVLADDHGLEEADPFWGFSSGYLQRGRHLVPKTATQPPWQLGMDYFADRRRMRQAPIDDGVLQFERSASAAKVR